MIGEELNLQVKDKILGHLETIDLSNVPAHYGQLERSDFQMETDSADSDQMG